MAPNEYLPSIYDLDLNRLLRHGQRAVLFDLDNTLVSWGSPVPPRELGVWIKRFAQYGLKGLILSNNHAERVRLFAQRLDLPWLAPARKPFAAGFRQAMAMLGTAPGETVMVGDQLFTDILGAKWAGLYTVLVRPIAHREFAGTRLVRHAERLVLGQMHAPMSDSGTRP